MTKTLSNISKEATEQTNTAGLMTTILSITPDDGMVIRVNGNVKKGDERGVPIYAELRDSNDDPLPDDTEVVLRYKAPSMEEPRAVSVPMKDILTYNIQALKDQQDRDIIDAVKHVLKGRALQVRDIDELQVAIDSSTVIDWANSRLHFEENAVDEFPEGE
jgi:hypothetical protein